MDTNIEIYEFMDQISYCLSLEFKDKWRHKFSPKFIKIFQDKVLKAYETRKPLKRSSLISTYTKKYKYDIKVINDFFECIDINLYYPLVYDDSYAIRKKKAKAAKKAASAGSDIEE